MSRKLLPRRAFLKGSGAALISLPFLDAMQPRTAHAQGPKPPLRTCICLYPYGSVGDTLSAQANGNGNSYNFPQPYAAAMNPLKSHITWINGLQSHWGFSNGDGAGDHARGQGTYLTQVRLDKGGIRAAKSCDRYIRDTLVGQTSLASLNVAGPGASGSDSGYSSEYKKISWVNKTTPDTPIYQPHLAFDELFENVMPGNPQEPSAELIQNRLRKSILDEAIGDANLLRTRLGQADRFKFDQYLDSIREVEQQIATLIRDEGTPPPTVTCDPGVRPNTNLDFDTRTRIMFELIRLAFQCDQTRLATFFMGTASFSFWGVSGDHHSISHHGNDRAYPGRLIEINRYYGVRFAEFITNLANTSDVDGSTLLDNCIVTFGTDLRDGDDHDNKNMSVAVAGRAGGAFRPGRLISGNRPLSNVWLSIMRAMGVDVASFGEGEAASTGTLDL